MVKKKREGALAQTRGAKMEFLRKPPKILIKPPKITPPREGPKPTLFREKSLKKTLPRGGRNPTLNPLQNYLKNWTI